jgi:hypothetical protein
MLNTSKGYGFKFKTLIFDEDEATAHKLVSWLRLCGVNTDCCENYMDFASCLESENYNLVIFDLNDSQEQGSIHAINVYKYIISMDRTNDETIFVLYTESDIPKHIHETIPADVKIVSKQKAGLDFLKEISDQIALPTRVFNQWKKEYADNMKLLNAKVVSINKFKKLSAY